MGLDVQLPRLGGQPGGLPLSRELADRVRTSQPDRDYQTFEQQVQQGQSTIDYLETVVLDYIGELDGLAHLIVTGTCEDPSTGDIYVVARTPAEPPVYYLRSYSGGVWSGWSKVTLTIKAHHVVPALYRGRVCLFWMDIKISNEPQQPLPAAQASSSSPNQAADRYVALGGQLQHVLNGSWAPPQSAKGKLFDKPFFGPTIGYTARQTEALYTLKVQAPAVTSGYGANLWVDVFRLGDFTTTTVFIPFIGLFTAITGVNATSAVHLGRAVFEAAPTWNYATCWFLARLPRG